MLLLYLHFLHHSILGRALEEEEEEKEEEEKEETLVRWTSEASRKKRLGRWKRR